MTTRSVLAWTLVGLVFGGSVAHGQSLVDIARKEEERRKAVKTPSKVYTVLDVRKASGVDPTAPLPAPQGGAATAAESPSAPAPAAKPAEPTPPDQSAKDEAYWRRVFTEARDRLARSSGFMSALKTQYDVLANRFTTVSDAAQRGAIVAEMEKVQGEIDRLQQDIDQQTKDLASLEDQARKAGVPPGWIRQPDH
jgi:hypothetical protein